MDMQGVHRIHSVGILTHAKHTELLQPDTNIIGGHNMKLRYVHAENQVAALKMCPWAVAVDKVSDGYYMCFESIDDYNRYTR